MNDSKRIGPRRDSFEVATRLRISNFDHHNVLRRMQKFAREAFWRVEERAIHGSIAVSDVQNLDMDSGARRRLSKDRGGKIRKHECREQRHTAKPNTEAHLGPSSPADRLAPRARRGGRRLRIFRQEVSQRLRKLEFLFCLFDPNPLFRPRGLPQQGFCPVLVPGVSAPPEAADFASSGHVTAIR